LSVVLGAFASLQVWHFEEAFVFHGDHERDLRMALGLVERGEWPAVTPTISPFPIQLGPLLYLILAPIVAVSADPFFVRNAFLLLTLCGCTVFFSVLRRWVRWQAAAFFVATLVASVFTFEMSRQLWHSSLLPLPIAAFFWGAFHLLQTDAQPRRYVILTGVFAAIAVQLHAVGSVYGLLWLGLVWLRRRDLKARDVWGAVGAGLIALLPFLWTLVQTLQSNAGQSGVNMPGTWQPANLWTVWTFFVENLKPIWGDNIGPLLIWPWLGLLLWGSITALRKRNRFGIFLLCNLVLGWIVESMLLGNQLSHRYMHANLWSSFALLAFGLNDLMTRWSPRWITVLAAATIGIITVEAWVSPVPHAGVDGWLNAREQRDVAQSVASKFPLSDAEMETRIHGLYFGELTGMGHFQSLFPRTDSQGFSKTAHVMVMSSDIGLVPHGRSIEPAEQFKGPHRTVAVYAFEPFVDWSNMTVSGPNKSSLFHKWRRLNPEWFGQAPRRGPSGDVLKESPDPSASKQANGATDHQGTTHRVVVPITHAGTIHTVMRAGRDVRDRCPLTAAIDGQIIETKPVDVPLSRTEIHAIEIKKPGTLHLQLGPCRDLRFFDLW